MNGSGEKGNLWQGGGASRWTKNAVLNIANFEYSTLCSHSESIPFFLSARRVQTDMDGSATLIKTDQNSVVGSVKWGSRVSSSMFQRLIGIGEV